MPRLKQCADKYRNEDFHRDVVTRLTYLGLQQHDLAVHLNVCDATVSQLLKHPEKISADRLRKMVCFLKLEPDVILRFIGFPAKEIKAES